MQERWGIQDKSVEEDEIKSLSLGAVARLLCRLDKTYTGGEECRARAKWQQRGSRCSNSNLSTG